MSNRRNRDRTPLWVVRRLDGHPGHLFGVGLQEMMDHMNRMYRDSGVQHAAREID